MLCDLNWIVLPRRYQDIVSTLLHQKQHATVLSLGPFGTNLNREYFNEVRASITLTFFFQVHKYARYEMFRFNIPHRLSTLSTRFSCF